MTAACACGPRSRALASMSSSSITASTSFAPAQTSGVPPKVVPCVPGPSRSQSGFVVPSASVTGRSLTQIAPRGNPPAIPFAQLIASGAVSGASVRQPHQSPVRPSPHCTSSNINSSACSSQSFRAQRKNSGVAGFTPLSPWIGSSKIATVPGSRTATRSASSSLNGTCRNPATIGSKPFFTFSCPVAAIPASVRP